MLTLDVTQQFLLVDASSSHTLTFCQKTATAQLLYTFRDISSTVRNDARA